MKIDPPVTFKGPNYRNLRQYCLRQQSYNQFKVMGKSVYLLLLHGEVSSLFVESIHKDTSCLVQTLMSDEDRICGFFPNRKELQVLYFDVALDLINETLEGDEDAIEYLISNKPIIHRHLKTNKAIDLIDLLKAQMTVFRLSDREIFNNLIKKLTKKPAAGEIPGMNFYTDLAQTNVGFYTIK